MTRKKIAALLLYVLESVIGAALGYTLYQLNPVIGAWCLISILLVLAPDKKDAVTLALNRIKANVIGAAIGLVIFLIHPLNLATVCIGIALAVGTCEFLNLKAATKSAAVAYLIITMHEPGKHFWDVALERAGGVMAGCILGVIITYIFHVISEKVVKPEPGENPPVADA